MTNSSRLQANKRQVKKDWQVSLVQYTNNASVVVKIQESTTPALCLVIGIITAIGYWSML